MQDQVHPGTEAVRPNPNVAEINVRNLARAKEWSLVLISQGIESTILPDKTERGYVLEVAAQQSGQALSTLKQYHQENPKHLWSDKFAEVRATFDWACLAWVLVCIAIYWFNFRNPTWLAVGGMDSGKVLSGQWWRLFTALFLHADLAHLLENMGIGIVLMGLTMGIYGKGNALLAALITGAAGNGLSLLLNTKPFHGLGASGLIMGCLGLMATSNWFPLSSHPAPSAKRWALTSAGAAIGLFLLLATSPGTDFFAHFGGFVCGLALGAVYSWMPKGFKSSRGVSILSGVIGWGVVIASWWLAWNIAS